jgi:hypothetical protein
MRIWRIKNLENWSLGAISKIKECLARAPWALEQRLCLRVAFGIESKRRKQGVPTNELFPPSRSWAWKTSSDRKAYGSDGRAKYADRMVLTQRPYICYPSNNQPGHHASAFHARCGSDANCSSQQKECALIVSL